MITVFKFSLEWRFRVLTLTFDPFNITQKLMLTTQRYIPTYFFGTDHPTVWKTLKIVPFLQHNFPSLSIFLFFQNFPFHPGFHFSTRKVTVAPWPSLLPTSSTTSMDPELVKGLQQIKKFLDDGTFSQQDFDKQQSALLDTYPVARPGPALGGVQHSPVSQPQASQPLKGVSDEENRDPITGRHLWGCRKCCKCPLLECYWTAQGFSICCRCETVEVGHVDVRGMSV
jgi:hypothetical protein